MNHVRIQCDSEGEYLGEWKEIFKKLNAINSEDDGQTQKIKIDLVVEAILSLNESTLSYWWRGGVTLRRSEVETFFHQADINNDEYISLEEFDRLWIENDFLSTSKKEYIFSCLKTIAYAKNVKKCPPPLFNLIISIIQVVLFSCYNAGALELSSLEFKSSAIPELWRYFSYCLVHHEVLHLLSVIACQLFLGILMETVHGSVGIGIVYLFGVFSGSLFSNVFDHGMSLIGGSGGCYALIGSQISCLILNWHEDHAIVISRVRTNKPVKVQNGKLVRLLKLVALIAFILPDTIVMLTDSYHNISIVAHVFGFIGGLLMGLMAANNRKVETWEKIIKIVSIILIFLMSSVGIIFNIILVTH